MTLQKFFIALAALTMGGWTTGVLACDNSEIPRSDQDRQRLRLAAAVKNVRPAIVVIQGIKKHEHGREKCAPAGLGVIVDRKGVVVTNQHVIEGLENIEIVLASGRKIAARSVVSDTRSNVAMVTLQPANCLPFTHLADSDKLEIGDRVLTFGVAIGDEVRVVAGIVSATDCITDDGKKLLQVDAAVGPGGPTGPVNNVDGNVIGLGIPFSNQAIGLAIPSNRINKTLTNLTKRM